MSVRVDKNGRQMSVCSECRRKARAAANITHRITPIVERVLRIRTINENGCWIAQLPDNGHGYKYMTISVNGKGAKKYVHRIAYEIFIGPIPAGLEIDHLCRNRACFNPEHLEVVTPAENLRRAAASKTHCKYGHEFTGENTRIYRGHRHCRKCHVAEVTEARRHRRIVRDEK